MITSLKFDHKIDNKFASVKSVIGATLFSKHQLQIFYTTDDYESVQYKSASNVLTVRDKRLMLFDKLEIF